MGIREEQPSFGGELYRTGTAVKKFYIQFCLQRLDLACDGRLGDVHLLSCLGKVQMLRDSEKTFGLKNSHGGVSLSDSCNYVINNNII